MEIGEGRRDKREEKGTERKAEKEGAERGRGKRGEMRGGKERGEEGWREERKGWKKGREIKGKLLGTHSHSLHQHHLHALWSSISVPTSPS